MLFFGGIWRTLILWTRKAVAYLKQVLLGPPTRSLEDSAQESLNSGGPAHQISERRVVVSVLGTILVIFWQECICFLPLS